MNVFICGAGTMGRGIALSSISSGHQTFLYDKNEDVLKKASGFIIAQVDKQVQKGQLTSQDAENRILLIRCVQVHESNWHF